MRQATIMQGDALTRLRDLADESVQCVVTSPPYWGLRDYKTDGQLGLERTPEEYVAKMVEVFREVRRVLRKDGTLWLNLGDSYNAQEGQRKTTDKVGWKQETNAGSNTIGSRHAASLKPKDLCGIPWRVAFALQADGWWLRSEIIWSKKNPMPESVTDRPTKSHEQVFLLTKSARYFYDAEAVKEPAIPQQRTGVPGWDCPKDISESYVSGGRRKSSLSTLNGPSGDSRNLRSVWHIATQPFPEAHFATFPEKLVEPCILAGTSEKGACAKCGAPWQRLVETPDLGEAELPVGCGTKYASNDRQDAARRMAAKREHLRSVTGNHDDYFPQTRTIGWKPSCYCGTEETTPCPVLDPFCGSGTVGVVALRYGRSFVGIELNPEYCEMAQRRIGDDAPLMNRVEMAEARL